MDDRTQQQLLFTQPEKFALIRAAKFPLSRPRARRLRRLLRKIESFARRSSSYSNEFLAGVMEVSIDTVDRARRDGELLGVLVVERRPARANVYRIQWDRLGDFGRLPPQSAPLQTAEVPPQSADIGPQTAEVAPQSAEVAHYISARPRSTSVESLESPFGVPEQPSVVCAELPEAASAPACASTPEEPSEFVFPTTGKGPGEWVLTKSKLAEYVEAYPSLDVRMEITKARQWCRDNANRRKTTGGMCSFLTRWLNRAVNRPSPGSFAYGYGSGTRRYDPVACGQVYDGS